MGAHSNELRRGADQDQAGSGPVSVDAEVVASTVVGTGGAVE